MFKTFITVASVLAILSAAAAAPASFDAATSYWPDTGGDGLNRRVGFRVALVLFPRETEP
jgi:hypothetical protein